MCATDTKGCRRVPRPAIALLGVLATTLVAGCGHRPDVLEVPVSIPLAVAGGLAGSAGGRLPGTGQQVSQALDDQGLSQDDVDSLTVRSMTLVHRSPRCEGLAGCDLSFIERLTIEASASGQPTVELGRLEGPGASRQAVIPPEVVELRPYLGAKDLALSATLVPRTPPIQSVELEVQATLRVDIHVL